MASAAKAIITLSVVALCAGSMQHASADSAANPVARDIKLLASWFEGEFDNEEQNWFQNDPRSATPEADRHERIHTTHTRLDLPNFGEHVFYVEEYLNNDPAETVRQRLVIFSSNPDDRSIRMQQGFFKKPKRYLGKQHSPEAFSKLKPSQVFFLDECDVRWQRRADQFEGKMQPKACVFGKDEQRRYSVHNLYLGPSRYWRVDTTFLTSDNSLHKGRPIDAPYRLRKSKVFTCEIIFNNGPGTEGQRIKGLRMHSQGGMVTAVRESDQQGFDLLMRDKEYPYYETRPDFIYLSLRKQGEQRSVAFTVNDPQSRTLGLSTQGIVAHCYRNGYEFRETYDQL